VTQLISAARAGSRPAGNGFTPAKNDVSRQKTYLFGAVAVLFGAVLIVIAIANLSGDDEDAGGGGSATAPAGRTETSPPAEDGGRRPSAEPTDGGRVTEDLARRRKVQAPELSLKVVDGGARPAQVRSPLERAGANGSLSLGRLRGTPVVLHMWSSGCAPCRADARLVENTWQRWGRRGVVFLGVSVDEPESAARRFASQYELSYPILSDDGGTAARAYGATSLPETFFIDSSGDIVGHVVGSPSVRQLELGTAATRTGRAFGSEQGGSRVPLG
jgi:peroxiredoxin